MSTFGRVIMVSLLNPGLSKDFIASIDQVFKKMPYRFAKTNNPSSSKFNPKDSEKTSKRHHFLITFPCVFSFLSCVFRFLNEEKSSKVDFIYRSHFDIFLD